MNTSTETSKKVKSTEILIYLNKSSNTSSLYTKSPPLVNGNEEIFNIVSNVTIDEKNYNDKTNASNSSGASFSSLSNTCRCMLGESSDDNILNVYTPDDELHINNHALKSLFLNILGRLDNTDIIMESI